MQPIYLSTLPNHSIRWGSAPHRGRSLLGSTHSTLDHRLRIARNRAQNPSGTATQKSVHVVGGEHSELETLSAIEWV
eukprot:6188892-Pleurochrysis_carterae.AAC.1